MQSNTKKDYGWNTIGVFAQNAISPLLLIVITRLNGIYDSGIFSYAFAVAVIFWAIGMWSGRTYQVSDVKQHFSRRGYIMARIILALCMLSGAVLFSLLNRYDLEKSSIIVVLVLFKALESVADSVYGVMQVHHKLFVAGKSLLYKATSGLFLFTVVDFFTKNILLSSLGIVAANLVIICFYDLRVTKGLEDIHIELSQVKHFSRNALAIIKHSAPVFVVLFLSMFSLNIPRYFVDVYHENQLGYFGVIAMPITLIGLVMTFVLQPKIVHLSNLYENKEYVKFGRIIRKIIQVTIVVGAGILLVTYLVGVPLLGVVFGIDFTYYKMPLMIIVGGGVVNALVSIFINILIIIRRFRYQFYILLVTNIVLAILSAYIVKVHGLTGSVLLFAGVSIVQAILLVVEYALTLQKAKHAIG